MCVCIYVCETEAQRQSRFLNSEITLSLGLFFSFHNISEWGQHLRTEPSDCVQREDGGEGKQKKGKEMDREAAGREKKELCPVAGTQTGWFG